MLNEGSIFSFVLPFGNWTGLPRKPVTPVGLSSEPPLKALRILLVEDSADNRTITLAYLEDTPYLVEIAETGAAACEMFAARAYDLVLMDRQMPVMDGLTATRTIRTWEQINGQQPTPVIALTASALKGDRETCMAAGCTAYLTKPIRQDVLLAAIKEHSLAANALAGGEPSSSSLLTIRKNLKAAERAEVFLKNCRQNIDAILAALNRDDFRIVEYLGHGMRGAGGMFGFPNISELGGALERAGIDEDTDKSRKITEALSAYLSQAEAALASARPSAATRDTTRAEN